MLHVIIRNWQPFLAVAGFSLFWLWETRRPFLRFPSRGRHAAVNVSVAVLNSALAAVVYSGAALAVAEWARAERFGLLNVLVLPSWAMWASALLILDAWTYAWHRANHVIPFLWRFHSVHHRDPKMDVSTATRFHPVEIFISWMLQLAVIAVAGIPIEALALYGLILLAVTQFHHADIRLPGKLDRLVVRVLVSPDMHKVHHSNRIEETDSNFSSVLSVWDRLFGSYRERADFSDIQYGIEGLKIAKDESIGDLLGSPFRAG